MWELFIDINSQLSKSYWQIILSPLSHEAIQICSGEQGQL